MRPSPARSFRTPALYLMIPYLEREGANRAYHEALGSMMGLAAMQKPFVVGLGLADSTAHVFLP
jgi:hypothetical protein